MYFDLNVPIPPLSGALISTQAQSKKGKGKQVQPSHSATFTPAQLAAIEARIDLLVHRASSPRDELNTNQSASGLLGACFQSACKNES
jgi:hypothetical protein